MANMNAIVVDKYDVTKLVAKRVLKPENPGAMTF